MVRAIYPGVFDANLFGMTATANNNDYVKSFNKFGYNPDVDAGIEEDIWDYGGNYVYVNGAGTLDVVSSSADDALTGSGIYEIQIFGLDENWDIANEVLTLNGTTPVTTINQYSRVWRLRALKSTSTDPNSDFTGNITATRGGEIQAYVPAGNTSTKMTHFSIPSGFTGFISGIYVSGGPNDDFVADLQVRTNGDVFYTAWDVEISNSNMFESTLFPNYGPIEEMSDIKFKASGVSNNAQCRVNYIISLIENEYLARLAKSFG